MITNTTRLTPPSALNGRLFLILLMMLLTTMTAWAEDVETFYVDENGTSHDITATVLDGTETSIGSKNQTTWYVVNSDINHSGPLTCWGNVNIILADDKTMTTSNSGVCIRGEHNSILTIYGQTSGTGTLDATSTSEAGYGIFSDSIIVNGGTVSATGQYGIHCDSILINDGTVTANGEVAGIYASHGITHNVTINGGKVTATGAWAIHANGGIITLGWKNADDFIKISSYSGTVNIRSDQALIDDNDIYCGNNVNIPDNVTLTPAHFTDNGDDTYTIWTATGWNAFCDALEGGTSFTGKTVKLGANITVTRMAGSSSKPFTGTFDGNQKTLTVSYGSADNRIAEQYAAPFRFVEGCTIQNLRVSGDIYTAAKYAAGIIAQQYGTTTISNCRSSVTINSSKSEDGTHGGFVATNSSTLNIEGCVFDGSLLGASTTCWGGFVGWRSGTVNVSNSLFDPANVTIDASDSYTFVRRHDDTNVSISNCYYTQTLGTAQGKAACPAIAAPVGDTTHAIYSVSQITPYANGLTCGETFYYGGGDNVSVSYVDENGDNVTHSAIALDPSHMPTELSGWYYVADDITYTSKITLGADVTFILADGKTMNIGTSESPISSGNCIRSVTDGQFNVAKYSLTIYGQSTDPATAGTLKAYNSDDYSAAVYVKNYTQHGCNVTIDATINTALKLCDGNLTLTRGTLTANTVGTSGCAISLDYGHSATVSGGALTATSTFCAIWGNLALNGNATATVTGTVRAIWGNLALNGTATATVTGDIYENVTIADGLVFTDGNGHYYAGRLSDDEKTAIDGQTLTRLTAVSLADATSNATAIGKLNGVSDIDITLQGRTLTKNGEWNTLCLPFDVTIAGSILDGATIKKLSTSSNLTAGVLTLNFENETTTLHAGTPYIIKWASGDNIVNPVFNGVTISSTTPTAVNFTGGSFVGQYSLFEIVESGATGDNQGNLNEIIMLGANSTLGYSKNARTLRSFRAHFEVPANGGVGARAFVLNFDEEASAVFDLNNKEEITNNKWYSLDGRRLNGKPTVKGLYIHNGRKVLVRDKR